MPTDILPLEFLNNGEWADIADVTGEPVWVTRLAELGVRAGMRLRMLQAGSPCLLQIGETRLSLRGDSETQVFVRPLAS